ncbi:MAG: flagellar basal body P-ring protein FlgI [Gammaproteobacteria bacterium]|nr:MAG: flagellar basal body P-ring protein FlgI [Gammaproteobacteria bacterium]
MKIRWLAVFSVLMLGALSWAERIKDIATVQGVRSNPLIGYGLVVGLDGTGEPTVYPTHEFRSMLLRLGITLPSNLNLKLKNVAIVTVQAELPPFARPGQTIDVTVSSLGEAKSLRGGSLLMTPLKGIDGQVYAIAQGNLVVGGFGAQGADGSKVTVNVPTTGRIPNGATIERTVPSPFDQGDFVTFLLKRPDFTTAKRMADAINQVVGPNVARPLDAGSVQVSAPRDRATRVMYLANLENITLTEASAPAKVVVNSRTGTIVIGQNVRVSPAAVAHGNLVVTIAENPQVSQPNPLAGGQTTVTQQSSVQVSEEQARVFLFAPGVQLKDIVKAINAVGAAPGDLMAILEALKQANALHAELVVI